MFRRFLMFSLAAGAIGGFWSGIHHYRHGDRHEAFERHVADLCSNAALRAYDKAGEKR